MKEKKNYDELKSEFCVEEFLSLNMAWFKIFNSEKEAKEAFSLKKLRRLSLNGIKICLAHDNEKFYAIQDKCPHSKASLSEGEINTFNEVVCPLHSYCYDLNTGREKDQKTLDATIYDMKLTENGLFIKFTE